MITAVGQLQTKGLCAPINPIGTPEIPQEHEVPPIGLLHLIENIGETIMSGARISLPPAKSTVEISSLELVKKTSNSEQISIGHEEDFEEKKASPGNIPTELDLNEETEIIMNFLELLEDSYQGPMKEVKSEHHLDNVNTGAGS
ncbi:hypothetical protein L6164_013527 [Bauhinia variegata]|uniref:Uncharacterized protein n=1 Tax=Bauhinia variegata TaxID=167791 RepID=A0ACB9NFM5_BAUVA|nr:hypothetical protein L6164_013527 [Bauhinia variegata]